MYTWPRVCLYCKKAFDACYPKQKTCSKKCMGLRMRGAGSYQYKGGTTNKLGYRVIYVNRKLTLEHRHVMAQALGRPLRKGEVVHHRDGNPSNNALENLVLLPSQAAHMREHAPSPRTPAEKAAAKREAFRRWYYGPKGYRRKHMI